MTQLDALVRFCEPLHTKAGNLRERVRRTETYRLWAETAGREQIMEAEVLASALP